MPRLAETTVALGSGVENALIAFLASMQFVEPDPPNVAFNFAKVYSEWPDAEEQLKYPSGAVMPTSSEYEPHSLSLTEVGGVKADVDGTNVDSYVKSSEWVGELRLEVWARSRAQRSAIMNGIEKKFIGTLDDRAGVFLAVPKTVSGICRLMLLSSEIIDDEEAVQRRERKARFRFRGWIANMHRRTTPELKQINLTEKDLVTNEILRQITIT